jgi:hypothetical protein
MALVFADLVQETTSTTGTGTLTLSGAVSGYQSFAAIGNTNTTYYRIKSGLDSEVGIGTYTLSGTTLSRDTVLYSSAGGTTKITVATGATVSCVYPAERAVYLSETGTLGIGGAAKATSEVAITEVGLANSTSLAGSALDIAQTWATTGNPTAIKLNVTNSQSGSTSKLMDLQVGGASKVSVTKSGAITMSVGNFPYSSVGGALYSGTRKLIENAGNTTAIWDYNVTDYPSILLVNGNTFVKSTGALGWADMSTGGNDLTLYRDAANTLAQRNSTNSQTSRIYNTYTDASNYERSALSFVTYSGALYTKLAAESAGTGAANIGIALSPKGTGAITAQVPDGTVAGGNARGANSVDLQMGRNNILCVASGSNSAVLGGRNNIVTGGYSATIGGDSNYATGNYSLAYGLTSGATGSWATASGLYAVANKACQVAFGIGQFSTSGDCQHSSFGFSGATSDAVATPLVIAIGFATIPNNTTWAADIDIVARSAGGTENAYFKRRLVIQKGTTAGSTALVGTVQTVGTDIGTTNMLLIATPITLTADTTNGALKLEVTGLAATNIRWVAKVSLVEVGYA